MDAACPDYPSRKILWHRATTASMQTVLQNTVLQQTELQRAMIRSSVQDRNILQNADLEIRERRQSQTTQNRPATCNRCMWAGKVPTFFHR
jgi:hypothetical protein